MRSDFVVITGISLQSSTQVCLAQDYDMIRRIRAGSIRSTFSKAILPRCAWCDGLVTNAHGAQPPRDHIAVDAVPIANQVARSIIPGERRRYLARNPFCRRMCCDVDPDQLSTLQPNDDKGIEQVEANGRSNEQIHRANVRRVPGHPGFSFKPRVPRMTHRVAQPPCRFRYKCQRLTSLDRGDHRGTL